MFITYQYRIYPNRDQQENLDGVLYAARWLYNRSLEYRMKKWGESRQRVTEFDQGAMWRKWRNEAPDDNPLRNLNVNAGSHILRRLDSAFSEFIRGKRGHPRFKGRHFFKSITYTYANGVKLKGGKLYVQNVGMIPIRWHRELPGGTIKTATITRKPSGWYAAFQIDCGDHNVAPSDNPPVGIDMGIKHALALSNGLVFDNPHYLKSSLAKLRRLQRRVARRQRGSAGRREAVQLLARHYEHIANQRRDWWHKVTRYLSTTYGIIAVEDLSLQFMLQNDKLSRAASDVSLGIFKLLLEYKAAQEGAMVIGVNPRNTTRLCSSCGTDVPKGLSERVHSCTHCGLIIDRDTNAAINILNLGMGAMPHVIDTPIESGANLEGANLSGAELAWVNLVGPNTPMGILLHENSGKKR